MLTKNYNSVAVANQSEAVESETTQKNGVMPKDLNIIRSRHHKIMLILFLLTCVTKFVVIQAQVTGDVFVAGYEKNYCCPVKILIYLVNI